MPCRKCLDAKPNIVFIVADDLGYGVNLVDGRAFVGGEGPRPDARWSARSWSEGVSD
jgi:arylsulfatase A-like enzyme